MPPNRNNLLDDGQLYQTFCYIHFPEKEEAIASSRRVVQQFGTTVMKIFADKIGRRDIEARTQRFTESEVQTLQSAFDFASTYAVLFDLINMSACGERHQAKVYLCGLQNDRLKVAIGTCQEHQWIPATFERFETLLPWLSISPTKSS